MNETILAIFTELGIPAEHTSPSLQALASSESRFLKDLKLNVAGVLKSTNFSKKETSLIALSVAVNQKNDILIKALSILAKNEGASENEIAEVHACTSLMNANNVLYRFRHWLPENTYYNNTPAGIRMSIMMNPVLGKELFEIISLAVSAINGCEMCVTSHENSVKQHGGTEAKIFDAIRIAAVIKSLSTII
jgi:alkyl hydroperoxide reductase subunit D